MVDDGIEVKGRVSLVTLGLMIDGVKEPLGLREGSTETPRSRPRCCPISARAASMLTGGYAACSTAQRRYVSRYDVLGMAPGSELVEPSVSSAL